MNLYKNWEYEGRFICVTMEQRIQRNGKQAGQTNKFKWGGDK